MNNDEFKNIHDLLFFSSLPFHGKMGKVMKMKEILEMIKEYEQILIYRHVNPDFDALGSQKGIVCFLQSVYPDKHIVAMGDFSSKMVNCFYEELPHQDLQKARTIGIVVDTANRERIDGDTSVCEKLIKIDHHIVVDSYGVINVEDEHASSCAQIIANMIAKTPEASLLSTEGANALYTGIVGDSNRFMYRNTDERTFQAAQYLLTRGIHIEEIYAKMYVRHAADLEVTKFILNHYVLDGGVAYYMLKEADLKALGLSREEGSNYVNTLANVEEFKVWMAITENTKDNNYRVSIRSREVVVNEIAAAFSGGGHALASGATLQTLDQLPDLLKALKEAINNI